jgi:hypothetical protein
MSAEQKDLEKNALAARMSHTWDRFKRGQLVSYKIMALVLLVAAGGFVWWYIASERIKDKAKAWIELENADTIAKLEKYRDEHKNSFLGRRAQLDIARTLIGPEGIDLLPPREVDLNALSRPGAKLDIDSIGAMIKANETRQKTAIENIQKARGMFAELADQFNDQPILKAECFYSWAKAEEVLMGVQKEAGRPDETLGNPVKLKELLEKVTETAPDTTWGKNARAKLDRLKSGTALEEMRRVQTMLLKREAGGPGGRIGAGSGIVAPTGGPTDTPTPPVPGVPGGEGPKAPTGPAPAAPMTTPAPTPGTPSVTPAPPKTNPTPPTGTTPIPPATAPVTPSGTPSTPASPPAPGPGPVPPKKP